MAAAGQKEGTGAALGSCSSGLVPSSTSHTQGFCSRLKPAPDGAFEIDAFAGRMKRMRAGVMTWSRVCTEWAGLSGKRYRPTFLTLTYAAVDGWEPKHISRFLACLNEWARRQRERIPYVWTVELQERGAPHYHLILWVPRRLMLPKPDKRGWWPHGSSRIGGKKRKGGGVMEIMRPVAYIAKYCSKGADSCAALPLPKGIRISGRGGLPRASEQAREARWWSLPKWLRDAIPLDLRVLARRASVVFGGARVTGAGGRLIAWVSELGEAFESPWASRWCPVLRRLSIWRVA